VSWFLCQHAFRMLRKFRIRFLRGSTPCKRAASAAMRRVRGRYPNGPRHALSRGSVRTDQPSSSCLVTVAKSAKSLPGVPFNKARPATRSDGRCSSTARAKFETAPLKTRAFARQA
jgi:hypothetical protein